MSKSLMETLTQGISEKRAQLVTDVRDFVRLQTPLWQSIPALALRADCRAPHVPDWCKLAYHHRLCAIPTLNLFSDDHEYVSAVNLRDGNLVFFPNPVESLGVNINDLPNGRFQIEKQSYELTPFPDTLIPRLVETGLDHLQATTYLAQLIPLATRRFRCSPDKKAQLLLWEKNMGEALGLDPPDIQQTVWHMACFG